MAQAEAFVFQARDHSVPVLKAGHKAALVWGFTALQYPHVITWVRFTDDADLQWEVDTALHVRELDPRDW